MLIVILFGESYTFWRKVVASSKGGALSSEKGANSAFSGQNQPPKIPQDTPKALITRAFALYQKLIHDLEAPSRFELENKGFADHVPNSLQTPCSCASSGL